MNSSIYLPLHPQVLSMVRVPGSGMQDDLLGHCIHLLRRLQSDCRYNSPSALDVGLRWIDTEAGLQEVLGHLLLVPLTCCIDCEWKHDDPCSLVSVVTVSLGADQDVLLLDALSLSASCPDLFGAVLRALLHQWVVVGFGVENDFERLAQSYGELVRVSSDQPVVRWRCIDLKKLYGCDHIGLSQLVRTKLGVEMSKELQCSPWEDRPLSSAQLRYAANDAQILWQLLPSSQTIPNSEGVLVCWGAADVQKQASKIPSATVAQSASKKSRFKTLAVVLDPKPTLALCVLEV